MVGCKGGEGKVKAVVVVVVMMIRTETRRRRERRCRSSPVVVATTTTTGIDWLCCSLSLFGSPPLLQNQMEGGEDLFRVFKR